MISQATLYKLIKGLTAVPVDVELCVSIGIDFMHHLELVSGKAFEDFGRVASVTVVKDKFSGESRGFGFVEMLARAEAQSAITNLNSKDSKGRAVNVNEARPRTEGRGRGNGGRQGGFSGGRGGRHH